MSIEPALLLIADIGGYTRFMTLTRTNLAHSQQLVAELLESVIDAAEPELQLAKLEGDAAFFYLPAKNGLPEAQQAEQLISRMRHAFREELARKVIDNVCTCEGCMKVGDLTLKFVVHHGEVAFQKVKRYTELAGVDVIIVHRMLKNDVPIREYVLMSEPLLPIAPPSLKPSLQALTHDFEGIGEMKTFYGDLANLPVPQPKVAPRSFLVKWLVHLGFMWRSLPYQLGLKKPVEGFRNFPTSSTTPS